MGLRLVVPPQAGEALTHGPRARSPAAGTYLLAAGAARTRLGSNARGAPCVCWPGAQGGWNGAG